MNMPLIELKEIFKTYSIGPVKTEALKGIDLTITRGDFVSIAGPSGSGKTTLLNLIGALDSPTSGGIYYEGKDIAKIPLNKLADFRLRQIGFVFQAYNLITTLTAIENVEYVMLLQGINTRERRKKAKDILERVELGNLLDKKPNQMSGGEQQRVAVARAIVSEPKVVLADEPTANLDSATGSNLLDLMKGLNRELNITFIFSTHDRMVIDKADKIFQLKDGKIIK